MTELDSGLLAKAAALRPLAADIVADRGLSDIAKVDVFLPVALGLRSLGLIYLPAELPGGSRLGEAIDKYFAEHYAPQAPRAGGGLFRRSTRGREGPDPEMELRAKRKTLDSAYDHIVAASPQYLAHLSWLERLDLNQMQVKRRPSLREMYVYGAREVRSRLTELEDIADRARSRAGTTVHQDRDQRLMEYVYANEFDPEYLKGLGQLLGYPECCVDAYAADRLRGLNVEQRAYEQVRARQEAGESIDVRSYYVKDFFPCRPDCPAAIGLGIRYSAALANLSDELGEIYTGALWSHFDLVQNYPAVINEHRRRLEQGQRR